MGKLISLIIMIFSFGFAVWIKEAELDYGALAAIGAGVQWQAFPAYLLGLYTNIGTNSILLGIIIGSICDIILVSLIFSGHNPFTAIHPSLDPVATSLSSLVGVAFNLIIIGFGHFCFRFKDTYNNDNNHLGINKIRELMEGIKEPATRYYGIFLYSAIACLFISGFHWIGDIDPELKGNDSLIYNGYIQNTIAGLPQWAFASIIWYSIAAILGIYSVTLWTTDDGDNKDQLPSKSSINISEEQTKLNISNVGSNENEDDIEDSIKIEKVEIESLINL